MTDTTTQLIPVACFALGVLFGAWLMYRRQANQPPVPAWMADPSKMFNWIRHGDAGGKAGEEPPPIDYEQPADHPGGRL